MIKTTKIGLVDDHRLIRNAISEQINTFEGFKVNLQADNGYDLKKQLHSLKEDEIPDIILMDIEMDLMNGYETSRWLKGINNDNLKELYRFKNSYMEIKICALSMNGKEFSIIEMLKSGATGYIFKDAEPGELLRGILDMRDKGYYYSNEANRIILSNLNNQKFHPSDQEAIFLRWACTQLTYKEIADKMCLSKRRIDGIREALFDKLNVKSRIGLVIYSIQRGIYVVET